MPTTDSNEFEAKFDTWATFVLAGEVFALRADDVQEVLMHQPLTPVPLAPQHIVGLLNLRGSIMPAIDLRQRLHFPPREDTDDNSLLVVKLRDRLVSVLVDEIGDVLELPADAWRAAPDTLAAKHREYVFGICPCAEQIILGLEIESAISPGAAN